MMERARSYDYPSLDCGWPAANLLPASTDDEVVSARERELDAELHALRAALPLQMEDARRQGREAAQRELQAAAQSRSDAERQRISAALEAFAQSREEYFRQVETDVVGLALAVAKKVLHREAAMDPLLLSGAVHVALKRLKDAGQTALRVPRSEASAWQKMFANDATVVAPEVIADPQMQPGDCVLETQAGTVELGVPAQLAEIEKGFFDLLDRKPAIERETA